MSRTITVAGSDVTSLARLDSIVIVEAALAGEVGQGGFNRDDEVLGDVPAMKAVTIDESAASPTRTFTGYIGVRGIDRGELGKVENRRQWDVTMLDLNTVLDDEVGQSAAWNRPAETDVERVTWLLTTGAISTLGITAGVVPNTNTVNMDAIDYRGYTPRRVLDECAEAAAKNYFLYDFGSGKLLYYDKATGTSLSSTARLTTVLGDIDNAVTWAIEEPRLEKDPTRVYSAIYFKYDGGFVTDSNSTTESTFRRREASVEDSSVKSAAKATNKAAKYLAAAATEKLTFTCGVTLPAANVNDIRAGQRIQVKVPHLGISAYTYYRIARRTVIGLSDVLYQLRLEFTDDIKVTGFGSTPTGPVTDPPSGPRDIDEEGGTTGDATTQVGSNFTVLGFRAASLDWVPSFTFTAGGVAEQVGSFVGPAWTHTQVDCPGLEGAYGPGREHRELWYYFYLPVLYTDWLGVEFSVVPPNVDGADPENVPADRKLNGVARLDGAVRRFGMAWTTPTWTDQWNILQALPIQASNSLFIPRAFLRQGSNFLVEAPGWHAANTSFYCQGVLDFSNGAPGAYTDTHGNAGDYRPTIPTGGSYDAYPITFASDGLSPWVSGDGLVNASNKTFTLISWDGTGVPQARWDSIILDLSDYTYDTSAKTVTFDRAPPVGTYVAFRYNVAL